MTDHLRAELASITAERASLAHRGPLGRIAGYLRLRRRLHALERQIAEQEADLSLDALIARREMEDRP